MARTTKHASTNSIHLKGELAEFNLELDVEHLIQMANKGFLPQCEVKRLELLGLTTSYPQDIDADFDPYNVIPLGRKEEENHCWELLQTKLQYEADTMSNYYWDEVGSAWTAHNCQSNWDCWDECPEHAKMFAERDAAEEIMIFRDSENQYPQQSDQITIQTTPKIGRSMQRRPQLQKVRGFKTEAHSRRDGSVGTVRSKNDSYWAIEIEALRMRTLDAITRNDWESMLADEGLEPFDEGMPEPFVSFPLYDQHLAFIGRADEEELLAEVFGGWGYRTFAG